MGWNIELVSLTEITQCIAYFIGIADNNWEEVQEYLEDFINYVMSENCIFSSFDQTTISFAILKIVCDRNHWYVYIQNLEELYIELNIEKERIDLCVNVIDYIFNLEDSEKQDLSINHISIYLENSLKSFNHI